MFSVRITSNCAGSFTSAWHSCQPAYGKAPPGGNPLPLHLPRHARAWRNPVRWLIHAGHLFPALHGDIKGFYGDPPDFIFIISKGIHRRTDAVFHSGFPFAEIQSAGKLPHDHHVKSGFADFFLQRAGSRQFVIQYRRTQIGEQAQRLPDGEQSCFRTFLRRQLIPGGGVGISADGAISTASLLFAASIASSVRGTPCTSMDAPPRRISVYCMVWPNFSATLSNTFLASPTISGPIPSPGIHPICNSITASIPSSYQSSSPRQTAWNPVRERIIPFIIDQNMQNFNKKNLRKRKTAIPFRYGCNNLQ